MAFNEKTFSGCMTRRADGALLGPWSAWVRHPAVGRASTALVAAIAALDALPPRVREIVILAVGGHFGAAYELYAHCAVGAQAGLDERQLAALAAGRKPDGLSDAEAVAYDCTARLARGGVLPGFLYEAARRHLGDDGTAQLIYLAGAYALISTVLNGYDVPAPETLARG